MKTDSSSKTPNWRFNSLSEKWKIFLAVVALTLFSSALEFWIFPYLLPIYEPSIQITSASVSFQESTVSLGFLLRTMGSELWYEYIKVSVREGIMSPEKFSTTVVIRSFTQPPYNITSINSTIAMGSWPRYNATDLTQLDRKMAEYGIIFKTAVHLEFVYTPRKWPRRTYTTYQPCREVMVGFHPNATRGILMEGPVKCRGSL